MLHFRKKGRATIEPALIRLPLVAFIDVVLFLLLYFVMEGSLAPPEGKLSSALAAERIGPGAGTRDMTALVLRVDMQGGDGQPRFRIGGREMNDRATLENVLKQLNKEAGIIIKVSDDTPVQYAATALQAVRNSGYVRVSYVAGS